MEPHPAQLTLKLAWNDADGPRTALLPAPGGALAFEFERRAQAEQQALVTRVVFIHDNQDQPVAAVQIEASRDADAMTLCRAALSAWHRVAQQAHGAAEDPGVPAAARQRARQFCALGDGPFAAVHGTLRLAWAPAHAEAAPPCQSDPMPDSIVGLTLLVALPRVDQQPAPTGPKRGRPAGAVSVPAPAVPPVMLAPADGAFHAVQTALLAPATAWTPDALGRPEYAFRRGRIQASVLLLPPGDERLSTSAATQAQQEAMNAALWAQRGKLGASELQLLMYCSNRWLEMAEPTQGIVLGPTAYAEVRGLNRARAAAHGQEARQKFGELVDRLRSLDVAATVELRTRGNRRETKRIHGRLLIAEVLGTVRIEPVGGSGGQAREDVAAWRLLPGAAWLASRELHRVGRYPSALIRLDPHKHGLLVRLGFYLGYQTAVRAASGNLAQPLSVRSILRGIGEPVPSDRRLLSKLAHRLEAALDELQALGVLTSWHWEREPERGRDGLLDASVRFVYAADALAAHAEHHAATRRALGTRAVRALLPEAAKPGETAARKLPTAVTETPHGGDKNSPRW